MYIDKEALINQQPLKLYYFMIQAAICAKKPLVGLAAMIVEVDNFFRFHTVDLGKYLAEIIYLKPKTSS